MTKRVLEFNCGDPKSNQQTASKVDLAININNSNSQPADGGAQTGTRSLGGQRAATRSGNLAADIQVFNARDSAELEDIEGSDDTPEVKNLNVKVPVNRDVAPVPQNSERFYVTARNPAVMREEIINSSTVKDELIRIFKELLIHNDAQLLANLIDRSGKIILKAADFTKLLAAMLSANGKVVKPGDIKLKYNEDIMTSCFRVKVSPFKHIVNISVGDQDLRIHQYECYNVLTNEFDISAELIYILDEMM